MKWCFLVNDAQFIPAFLGKLAFEASQRGDGVFVVFNSKLAEYDKRQLFPKEAKVLSKVDWCIEHYNPQKKEFGDFCWKEFFPIFPRWTPYFIWNYEKAVNAVSQLFQFFEFVLLKEKPDVLIGEPPAGLFGEVAYFFAKKHRIPFLGIADSRINLVFYDLKWTDTRLEQTFKKIAESDIAGKEKAFLLRWMRDFISHAKKPAYTKSAITSLDPLRFAIHYGTKMPEIASRLRYFWERRRLHSYDYESEGVFAMSVRAPYLLARMQVRRLFQRRFFEKTPEDSPFFVYPLHVEPESSTLVMAPFYADQLATIRNIAFSLPFPYKLYVKEHPAFVGSRPDKFYEEVKKIPNAALVPFDESVPRLIQKSLGVITLSSTVGLEAVLSGKPAYVLGNVFYIYHPLVRKVQNFDDLREKIRKDLANRTRQSDLEAVSLRFLASYIRNTIEGSIVQASNTQDRNNYKAIYTALRQRVDEIKRNKV